jgi:mono/diheme cytochrome c family protein
MRAAQAREIVVAAVAAIAAAGGVAAVTTVDRAQASVDEARLARGAYLAGIMDCGGCHTPGALIGKPDAARHLAGGDVGFAVPGLGVFFPPNLTPDRASGLGAWRAEDIVRAVREGVRPDGRVLVPAMPWHAYAALTDEDAADLAAYLQSLPPLTTPRLGPYAAEEPVPAPYFTVAAPSAR